MHKEKEEKARRRQQQDDYVRNRVLEQGNPYASGANPRDIKLKPRTRLPDIE